MTDQEAENLVKENFLTLMVNKDFEAFKRDYKTLFNVIKLSIKMAYLKGKSARGF